MPLIGQVLKELRTAKGLSHSKLSRLTVQEEDMGVSEAGIKAIEKNPGRVPEAHIIEALARALDVPADQFYEWPIAVARRDARARADAQRRLRQAQEERAQRTRERHDKQPEAKPGQDAQDQQR